MGFKPQNIPRLEFPESVRAVVGSLCRNGQILGFGQNPRMVRRAQVNPTTRFFLPDPDVLKHKNARKHRHLHFRNPSVLWWGQFAEMDKFLVLAKTRQCKVKGASVCLEKLEGNRQRRGRTVPNFFFILVHFLHFLLIARADCSPRWGHMCVQKHSNVLLF